MYVPPYVPQPTEIPGNVTTERYLVRLGFIRRVALLHFASVGIIVGLMRAGWTFPSLTVGAWALLGVLAASSLLRTLARGARWEPWVSLGTLPAILASLAGVLSGLREVGWPVWAPGIGLSAALVYTFACGRDLSFVGMFFLSGLASSIAMILVAAGELVSWSDVATGSSVNLVVLLYFVYDLGSLLSRRRLGEEPGAVVDLYRDILNFFGYSIRSVRHWREHRIWSR